MKSKKSERPRLAKPRSLAKSNSVPIIEDHCLISCIYEAEISIRGGIPALPQSTIVNLVSKGPITGLNSFSLTPPAIEKALAPAKAAALITSGSLECLTCGKSAFNICSSVEVYRGTNSDETLGGEKINVLHISERVICCCNEDNCISEARRRRNNDARKGGQGIFKLAFRCAIKPISSVLSVTTQAGRYPSALSNGVSEKENASNNIRNRGASKMKIMCG